MSEQNNDPKECVERSFCDERTRRIEAKIDAMKNEILLAINQQHSMSWKAKATIIASFFMAVSSIIVAFIYAFS